MGKLLVGLFLFLLSSSLLAELPLKIQDIKLIASAYYDLGSDNNYLEFLSVSSAEFADHRSRATRLNLGSWELLVESVKKCVFMQKGAYGDHLDSELQDRIAYQFAGRIDSFDVYEVADEDFDMGGGIFMAPCALAVEDLALGEVLLLQAAATD